MVGRPERPRCIPGILGGPQESQRSGQNEPAARHNARLFGPGSRRFRGRVPKQVPLARLLGVAQGNLSKFLDGEVGGSAALALRTAALLNRSVEDVLGAGTPP